MKNSSNAWLDVLKGMIIGVANIIPGVSGGTMMVSMGIYDKLIESITHIFSDWKKSLKFLFPILIGVVLSIALLSKLFEYLLTTWPIATNLGFCGLIAGSLPSIFKQVRGKGFNLSMLIPFAVFFAFIVISAFFTEESGTDVTLQLNLPGVLMLFLVGVISAATMVIPGVSGSMILMLLGYYTPIISLVSLAVDSLIHFDWAVLLWCCGLGIPFAIGIAVGIFAIAKLIEWVMDKWRTQTYWAIIGLIVASPIAILIKTDWTGFGWGQLACGIVALIAGAIAADRLSEH